MTKTSPWFKFDSSAYLIGTEALSLEEQGAYVRLLANMYDRDGPLPNDDEVVARMLGGNVRRWRRIKAALINAGKIKITASGIINDRAMREISERRAKSKKAAAAARKRHENQTADQPAIAEVSGKDCPNIRETLPIICENIPEKPNEINGSPSANALPIEKEIERKKEETQQPHHYDAARDVGCDGFELEKKLRDAAGDSLNHFAMSLNDVTPIRLLLGDGFDLDRQILPVIREHAKTKSGVSSWKYFATIVRKTCGTSDGTPKLTKADRIEQLKQQGYSARGALQVLQREFPNEVRQ